MKDNKGKFTKGNPGRPKGSKNRATAELRERFQILLDKNIDNLQKDLDKLEPKDRINAILNLSQYVLPKLKAHEIMESEPIEISFLD